MKYKGELGLLTVAIIWGSGFVASDISLGFFTPFQVLAMRFVLAALVLAAIFPRYLKQLDRQTILHGALLGVALYLAFMFQTIGLVYTTPSKNAFLTAVNVIIVPFIGLLLYRRPIDRYGTVGAFVALLGVGLISFNLDLSVNVGDVLTLVCAASFAVHIFFTDEFLKRGTHPVSLTILQMTSAGVIGLVVGGVTSMLHFGEAKGGAGFMASLLAVVYLALMSTTAAFLLQTVSQKSTTATRAAVILATESVFGTVFSAWLLKEQLTVRAIIGSILVFIAIIIAEVKPGLKIREVLHGHD